MASPQRRCDRCGLLASPRLRFRPDLAVCWSCWWAAVEDEGGMPADHLRAAVCRSSLRGKHRAVMLTLIDLWLDPETLSSDPVGISVLAQDVGLSRETVRLLLADLVNLGWLSRHKSATPQFWYRAGV